MKNDCHILIQVADPITSSTIYGIGLSYDVAVEDARLILGGGETPVLVELKDAHEFDMVCIPCSKEIYDVVSMHENLDNLANDQKEMIHMFLKELAGGNDES